MLPPVQVDLRPGSDFRKRLQDITDSQYGIVSFPRSGHNWLSRMLAEIIKTHCCHHNESPALGIAGGMGKYVGLKSQRPDAVERQKDFFFPFPVVYGSHGHVLHDGFDPSTKCYLYRDFWSVWKSTRKANAEMLEDCLYRFRDRYLVDPDPEEMKAIKFQAGSWWGRNFWDCLKKYVQHRWAFRKAPLQISYKELQQDTHGVLRRICDHMGVTDIPDSTIEKAVRAGSRENMLREQADYGSPNPFQTVNPA